MGRMSLFTVTRSGCCGVQQSTGGGWGGALPNISLLILILSEGGRSV